MRLVIKLGLVLIFLSVLLLGFIFHGSNRPSRQTTVLNSQIIPETTGRVIIKPKPEYLSQISQELEEVGYEVEESGSLLVIDNRLNLSSSTGGVSDPDRGSMLENDSRIEYQEEEDLFYALKTPNDTNYYQQSYLEIIKIPGSWDFTTGLTGGKIAILDTGVNGEHDDFGSKVLVGKNFVASPDNDITAASNSDDNGHGTEVAGVAAAVGNNGQGIAGVDWNVDIVPVKVLNAIGAGNATDLAGGIRWAADQGVKLINVSAGSSCEDGGSQAVKDAIDYAYNKGSIVIAASGNDGNRSQLAFPACYTKTLSVGSINTSGDTSSFSSTSSDLDVMAVGENVYTTKLTDGSYDRVSGTSVAAPQISGALSLLMAAGVSSAIEASNLLIQNATALSSGFKKANVEATIIQAQNLQATWQSQSDHVTTSAGTTVPLSVAFKNTGQVSWSPDSSTPVRLAVHNEFNLASESSMKQLNPGSWLTSDRIMNVGSSVAVDSTHTFNFNIKIPSNFNPGEYYFAVRLVAEGAKFFDKNQGAWWRITVPEYSSQWVSQSSHITATVGETINLSLALKNNGSSAWLADTNPFRLAVHNNFNLASEAEMKQYQTSNWISSDRVAGLSSNVAAGDSYNFNFSIKIPTSLLPGEHYFAVRPVIETYQFLPVSQGAWWRITVGDYQAQWVSQSANPTVTRGGTTSLSLTLQNVGTADWNRDWGTLPPVHLGLNKDKDESIGKQFTHSSWLADDRPAQLASNGVDSGENGTFNFIISAPSSISPGVYRLYVRPVAEGYTWFEDADGAWWDVTVQ